MHQDPGSSGSDWLSSLSSGCVPLSAEEQWVDSQAIVRDDAREGDDARESDDAREGDDDSDDHNNNYSGVDSDCDDVMMVVTLTLLMNVCPLPPSP